ncbi:MAG TPA: bifunctional nuclease family protein [Saprospiraceae bacterium]|nr:bifunctional nuclease family protein [Saprospiraceae bacterium]
MNKIELEIVALSHSVTQSHNYAVVLGEVSGNKRLPIVIGGFEAQAIAVAMENMTPNRPLTHDLFKNTLETFGILLKEIVINNLQDGIFYAQLVCLMNGKTVSIDSRTSDAIAMAVRFECPIYTYDFIMEEAGVVLEESSEKPKRRRKKGTEPEDYGSLSTQALQNLLDEVLSKEDYEKAAKIRDEINRRKADQ